jgi:predicted NBD/HSP70 family sugar kinase
LRPARPDMSFGMRKPAPKDTFDPIARGFAQAGVRIGNERAVMTLIGLNPGSSNADLARLSGLGPQTTSRIIAELEARDLVTRGEVLRGRRGQPATPIFINPQGAFTIGVEIGWRHVEVLLFSLGGQTLASLRRSYAWPDTGSIIGLVAAEIATMRAGMTPEQSERLAGVGVATPTGIGDVITQLGAPPEQAEAWQNFDLVGKLERACGLPVEWFNDGNAACWSEIIAHPQPRPPGLAYFQVGTLIAAGIVVGGELWQGPTGNAANLGAIMVCDGEGDPSFVFYVASIMALERLLVAKGRKLPEGNPLNWDWPDLEDVVDPWLDHGGRAIAVAIVSTHAMMDVDLVVVDGVMPRVIVERLLNRVRHHLGQISGFPGRLPKVEMGRNGASASATGAAQLVLFHRYFSRGWNMFAA